MPPWGLFLGLGHTNPLPPAAGSYQHQPTSCLAQLAPARSLLDGRRSTSRSAMRPCGTTGASLLLASVPQGPTPLSYLRRAASRHRDLPLRLARVNTQQLAKTNPHQVTVVHQLTTCNYTMRVTSQLFELAGRCHQPFPRPAVQPERQPAQHQHYGDQRDQLRHQLQRHTGRGPGRCGGVCGGGGM